MRIHSLLRGVVVVGLCCAWLLPGRALAQTALENGGNQAGTIASAGGSEVWTFDAAQGETAIVSITRTGGDTTFAPSVTVLNPSNQVVGTAFVTGGAGQVQIAIAATGTFTATVQDGSSAHTHVGTYLIRLAKSPGTFVVPTGDEGGAMTNGENHPGFVDVGDLDMWSFQATQGDAFILSIANTDQSFEPEIRVFDPHGTYLNQTSTSVGGAAQLQLQAGTTGTYTVVVSSWTVSGFANTGHYMLRLAKVPGTFVAPTGDEGGAMTNGANHPGATDLGDLDMWTFQANQGDSFVLSIANTDNSYEAELRVFNPNGVYLGAASTGFSTPHGGAAQIELQASVSGTYTVVVSADTVVVSGTGQYMLRLAKVPGTFVVPTGDEGGAMTNGGNHPGMSDLGDLDIYTFQATSGDSFVLSIANTDNTFSAGMRVFDPAGTDLVFDSTVRGGAAQIQRRVTVTGTYTVVVSADPGSAPSVSGAGHYTLRLAKSPGTFVVPTGDEGGALANGGNHSGSVDLGDLDMWSFQASQGDSYVLSIANTDSFSASLRIFDPNGVYLGDTSTYPWQAGRTELHAQVTGTYTVVVSAEGPSPAGLAGTGQYIVRLAKSPGAFIVPTGDEGGALRNGQTVSASLTLGDLDMWSFVATAGTHVSITLTSPLLAIARLFGPTGTDLMGLVGGLTSDVLVPTTGRYTIVMQDLGAVSQTTPTVAYTLMAAGIVNDLRGTTTSLTVAPTSVAAGATATITAVVTDVDFNVPINPAGIVTFGSSVAADGFSTGTCTLVPTPATTNQASCQVTITPTSVGTRTLSAAYSGSATHAPSTGQTSLAVSSATTTMTVTAETAPVRDGPQVVMLTATISGTGPVVDEGTVTFTLRKGGTTVGTPVSAAVSKGSARGAYLVPGDTTAGTLTIAADYSGSANLQATSGTATLAIVEQTTYSLAEGATGSFFHTDILLANPNHDPAPVRIDFLKEDGQTVTLTPTLVPTSRLTISVETVDGMQSANFSTVVTSLNKLPLVVERTMYWDASGYGAHTEKANEGVGSAWYFAEGSQGFFHTFFLLLNPEPTPNVAHVTYVFEDASTIQRDYPLGPTSRLTIDCGAEPSLLGRSFGATIVFDQPGMAERSMYFGSTPLFSGGTGAAGIPGPGTTWQLAEGATGSFFNTFLLIANPNADPATATVTYLLDDGHTVVRQHPLSPYQRLTLNVALEDPSLESAAFGTVVVADRPIVVERSQYWPVPNWYEAHSSMAIYSAGLKWGLAEGRVGGASQAQTYVLVANPGATAADLTVTFLRADGTTLVKHFTVAPTSRFNIAVSGPDSTVPELKDETFGTVIESTQPVLVERSLYWNDGDVIWAAGTNATGTRLP